MTPRTDIIAVDVTADEPAALATIHRAGHSRIPVYEGNLDNIIGLLYTKDLLWELARREEGWSKDEGQRSKDEGQRSKEEGQRSKEEGKAVSDSPSPLPLDPRPSPLAPRPSTLDHRPWSLDIRKVMRPPLFVPESRHR